MTDFITHDTVKTRYWHKLEDGRIQCDVCPIFCKLHEGQRGLCFVRQNLDSQIVMTSYGDAPADLQSIQLKRNR